MRHAALLPALIPLLTVAIAAAAPPPTPTTPGETRPQEAAGPTPPDGPAPLSPTEPSTDEPVSSGATPSGLPAASHPPPHFYVEPAPGAEPSDEVARAAPYEPPPPARVGIVYEPPPPPIPRHVAPRTALWAGARLGWMFPMGSLYCAAAADPGLCVLQPWSDFAGDGFEWEVDVGARVGRYNTVFLFYDQTQFSPGDLGGYKDARGTFYGAGFRFSSDPNDTGLLLELALGSRTFEVTDPGGTQLEFSNSLDIRIGIGADIRISKLLSIAPLLTFGGGSFGKARAVDGARSTGFLGPGDAGAQHVPVSLQLGGHFDLFGSQ